MSEYEREYEETEYPILSVTVESRWSCNTVDVKVHPADETLVIRVTEEFSKMSQTCAISKDNARQLAHDLLKMVDQ